MWKISFLILLISISIIYPSVLIKPGPDKSRNVFILNYGGVDIRQVVWIFPGYQNISDDYLQNPRHIIRFWRLEKTAEESHTVIILPDIRRTVYPLYEKDSTNFHYDMLWLLSVHKEISGKFKNVYRTVFAGISTGVEGAVKFASIVTNKAEIIAVSGTYDYAELTAESGEYRIHLNQFGSDPESWNRENPIEIIKKFDRIKIWLFCEENSIYYRQAVELSEVQADNIDIINRIDLGNKNSHGWKFWKSGPMLKCLMEIIEKRAI